MKRRRRLRKLVPDEDLIRRRAADEPLRELAPDYNVAHTTLGRFFERPVPVRLRLAPSQEVLPIGSRRLRLVDQLDGVLEELIL